MIAEGKPRPSLLGLEIQVKSTRSRRTTFTRRFQTHYYDTFPWLTACERTMSMFCWPCLLFVRKTSAWNKKGYRNLNSFHMAVKCHVKSVQHTHSTSFLILHLANIGTDQKNSTGSSTTTGSSTPASSDPPQQEQQNAGGETKAGRKRPRKDSLHARVDVSSVEATPSTSSSVGSTLSQSSSVTSQPELVDPLFVACPSPAFVDVSTSDLPPPPDLCVSPAWRPGEETVPSRALKSLENGDGELNLESLFSSYMCGSGLLTLTGIKMSVFRLLLSLLPPVFRSHGLSKENCLLIFLLQMKTGMESHTVETLFCIPRATNIFHSCLSYLKESTQQFIVWPDKRTVISTMPDMFVANNSNCRVILYCLEIRLETPNWSDLQSGWYKSPSERSRKMIIGFTPLGTISFVSKAFPGDTTIANLILTSGVLDLMKPQDGVFVVLDDEQQIDWKTLHADPRSKCIAVFKPNDSPLGIFRKASIWAHSMHQIGRLKSYKMLNNLSWELRETVESVVNVACVLANLQPLQE